MVVDFKYLVSWVCWLPPEYMTNERLYQRVNQVPILEMNRSLYPHANRRVRQPIGYIRIKSKIISSISKHTDTYENMDICTPMDNKFRLIIYLNKSMLSQNFFISKNNKLQDSSSDFE